MVLLLSLLLAVSVKEDNASLRSGCSGDAPLVTSLPAGTPLKLRYALSGESVPCYKVAVDMGGRQIDGYLPATAIDGLDTFDKSRKDAAWVTTSEALNAVRGTPSLAALKPPSGARPPLPASLKVVLAQAEQLIDANQPGRAMALLEPEIQKLSDAERRVEDARQRLAKAAATIDHLYDR